MANLSQWNNRIEFGKYLDSVWFLVFGQFCYEKLWNIAQMLRMYTYSCRYMMDIRPVSTIKGYIGVCSGLASIAPTASSCNHNQSLEVFLFHHGPHSVQCCRGDY